MRTAAPNQPINDREIVRRAQGGDRAAFGELYALHHNKIYCLCLRMVKNPAEAEDLTQEAFAHLLRKLKSFRGESQFGTWFHRLTLNIILSSFRDDKTRRYAHVSIDELVETGDGALERQIATVDFHQALAVDRITLERAVARLPLGYRTVFTLFAAEGLTHKEIAFCLGRTTGRIKSQLHKARKCLRDQLGVSPRLPGIH
jgi:RNA polymerase sigma-70 factor (ECF subfamily)